MNLVKFDISFEAINKEESLLTLDAFREMIDFHEKMENELTVNVDENNMEGWLTLLDPKSDRG